MRDDSYAIDAESAKGKGGKPWDLKDRARGWKTGRKKFNNLIDDSPGRGHASPVATTVGGPIEDLPGFWVFPEVIRSGRFIFKSRHFFWR